jgi:L-ribulose-5-phosphate 4-epimerase
MDEKGVVKFNCSWIKEKPLEKEWIIGINSWRDRLYKLGLIGLNKDNIGYGNISIRYKADQFIISGSATGKLKYLTNKHYTRVTGYDLNQNSLNAVGPIIASSESLTHAAIYKNDQNINAIIHIHHLEMWNKLLNIVPTTHADVEYGTPEMAWEIDRLFKDTNLKEVKILVMAGHLEGIVSFGSDLDKAGKILLARFKPYENHI